MNNEKLENLLNVSLSVTDSERERSAILDTGYSKNEQRWNLIIRYSKSLDELRALSEEIEVLELLGGFAIITTPQELVEKIADLPSVIFVEMPKRLNFAINEGKASSCVNLVQQRGGLNLTGRGVLVGIVDSGIDITHPDFRNSDGTTRILRLLNQGDKEYLAEELNEILLNDRQKAKQFESTGHGTAVAGIVAGNGRASDGRYTGMAPDSELVIVKLGVPDSNDFPRTTQLMAGVDYLVRLSMELERPKKKPMQHFLDEDRRVSYLLISQIW